MGKKNTIQWHTQKKCFVTVGVLLLFLLLARMRISYRLAASAGIPSAERFRVKSFDLFSGQLLVQFGDVVVPLGLVAGSRHRGSQVVFLPEALDLELAAAVSRAVGEDALGAGQAAWLLVHQPHVPVET